MTNKNNDISRIKQRKIHPQGRYYVLRMSRDLQMLFAAVIFFVKILSSETLQAIIIIIIPLKRSLATTRRGSQANTRTAEHKEYKQTSSNDYK
jgi:hypothetical protein